MKIMRASFPCVRWIHSSTIAQYRKYNSFSRSLNKNKSEIFLPYLVFVVYMTCNGLASLQNSFKSGVHFSFENSKLGFNINTMWCIQKEKCYSCVSERNLKILIFNDHFHPHLVWKVLNVNFLILKVNNVLKMIWRFLFYLKSSILTGWKKALRDFFYLLFFRWFLGIIW